MTLRLSVALCTRNGAAYLPEQLSSLRQQSRQPDELVVGDDDSTDATVSLVEDLASSGPFPVRLQRNSPPLGPAGNFAATALRCEHEAIALADQDDRWYAERLAAGVAAIESSSVDLAFSDADLVDREGRPLGRRLWQQAGIDESLLERVASEEAFTTLLARRVVTGATVTIRASLIRQTPPPAPGWIHDEWYALFAALRGGLVAIRRPLIAYRQHGQNAVGAPTDGFWTRSRRALDGMHGLRLQRQRDQLIGLLHAMESLPWVPARRVNEVRERLAHVVARLAALEAPRGRIGLVLGELRTGRYRNDALGHWSALRDLLG